MCKIKYDIKHNINGYINDEHDKIILKEIINVCGTYDLLEYEVDVATLKEALDIYFAFKSIGNNVISKNKNKSPIYRGKWVEDYVNKWGKLYKCSNCEKISINKTNYCSNCGRQMEV